MKLEGKAKLLRIHFGEDGKCEWSPCMKPSWRNAESWISQERTVYADSWDTAPVRLDPPFPPNAVYSRSPDFGSDCGSERKRTSKALPFLDKAVGRDSPAALLHKLLNVHELTPSI